MSANKATVLSGLSSLSTLLADKAPAAEVKATPSKDGKLSNLARCYISEAVGSSMRVPSLKLNAEYRMELLTRKAMLEDACRSEGSEAAAVVHVVRTLATDGDLFDAQKLLQSIMTQTVWMGAVDTSRADRVFDPLNEQALEHDLRNGMDAVNVGRDGAPYGLQGASDNEDAITGFAGDTEAPVAPSVDEINQAVLDVNLWINTLGTAITLQAIPYTSVSVGHNARGKAVWREVHDVAEAIAIQQDRNLKALQKRNATIAAEAVLRNAELFDACIHQAA